MFRPYFHGNQRFRDSVRSKWNRPRIHADARESEGKATESFCGLDLIRVIPRKSAAERRFADSL